MKLGRSSIHARPWRSPAGELGVQLRARDGSYVADVRRVYRHVPRRLVRKAVLQELLATLRRHDQVTVETHHGVFTLGVAYSAPWRIDRYTPKSGGRAVDERRMATGPEDFSPPWSMYPTGYNPSCGCCWLNIPHTEAQHRAELGEREAVRG